MQSSDRTLYQCNTLSPDQRHAASLAARGELGSLENRRPETRVAVANSGTMSLIFEIRRLLRAVGVQSSGKTLITYHLLAVEEA